MFLIDTGLDHLKWFICVSNLLDLKGLAAPPPETFCFHWFDFHWQPIRETACVLPPGILLLKGISDIRHTGLKPGMGFTCRTCEDSSSGSQIWKLQSFKNSRDRIYFILQLVIILWHDYLILSVGNGSINKRAIGRQRPETMEEMLEAVFCMLSVQMLYV
jgi:hypothetical protein